MVKIYNSPLSQKDTLTVTAPNEFARDWLEERYSELISSILFDITGEELNVKFIIPQNKQDDDVDLPNPPKKSRGMRNMQSCL